MPHDPAQARPQTLKRPRRDNTKKKQNINVNKINAPRIVWQKWEIKRGKAKKRGNKNKADEEKTQNRQLL